MRASIEPSVATPEKLNIQLAHFSVGLIDGGDFQFPACRRAYRFCDIDRKPIVEVEASHGPPTLWILGLLLNRDQLAFRVKSDDAVALGVIHSIGEDASPLAPSRHVLQDRGQGVPIE